ncbi:hypothetical protein D3C71_546710 [compost metagenome]
MDHLLLSNFLQDIVSARRITPEHIAGELDHSNTAQVEAWLAGWSAPRVDELADVARVLHVNPVVMTAGWLVDQHPGMEGALRASVFDVIQRDFPRSDDDVLRAVRKRPDMNVGDPHDEVETPALSTPHTTRKVLKVSPAARMREGGL